MNPELPVGAYFLRHIPGWGGRLISAAQGFVRGGDFWTHAGLIIDGGWYIQGQPRGAVICPVGSLFDGQPLLVSDAPVMEAVARSKARMVGVIRPDGRPHDDVDCWACEGTEVWVRRHVAEQGRQMLGVGYSYLDYPALGLAELARAHPKNKPLTALSNRLRSRINSGGHLICSALVDRAYTRSGIQLFDDDRMAGDVTPEDLAIYAYDKGRRPLIDTREDIGL